MARSVGPGKDTYLMKNGSSAVEYEVNVVSSGINGYRISREIMLKFIESSLQDNRRSITLNRS